MQIDNFSISGLFGYLNFNIEIKENRLLLVAENGAGKTNILRLLYLFLSKQWSKLVEYEFDTITATINNKEYKFAPADFDSSLIPTRIIDEAIAEYPLYESFIKFELTKYKIRDLLSDDFLISEIESNNDVPIGMIYSILGRLAETEFHNEKFDWDINVLYLPTYRRIERSFTSLYADLDKRLYQFLKQTIPSLNTQIEQEKEKSESDYSNIENDLTRIFETLWRTRDFERWSDKQGDFLMELIEFGMEDVQYRLNTVLSGPSENQGNIELYLSTCNKYLSDSKQIVLTKSRKYIEIYSPRFSEPISMAALSSGEKQILSLFSYLVLAPKNTFVIIDEPELSLSISWQEMLMNDLVNFSICGIVTATHSPFIVSPSFKSYTHGLNEFSI